MNHIDINELDGILQKKKKELADSIYKTCVP